MTRSADRILDELLVLQCQGGNADAFRRLVSRWQGPLRLHARYLVGNSEAARDIAQDAWVDIARTIHKLREPASFRGWAFRIVGHKAADWVRRERRRRQLREEAARNKPEVQDCNARDASAEEATSVVRRAINSLPPDRQRIVRLKYLDQLSVPEIAEILGIPTGTVKSRLYHAREQLRRALEEDAR